VLAAATRHAAEKVGRQASIEPGQEADALLLDANPLESVEALVRPEHLIGVVRAGELVDLS
jgi:imidazolonepropionase-like amidohydrolase